MPWLDEELEAGELDRAFHTAPTLDEGEAVVVSGGIGAVELGFETDEEGTRRLMIRPADDEDSEKANFRSNVVLLDGAMKNGTTQARQSGLSVAGEEDVRIAPSGGPGFESGGREEYLFASDSHRKAPCDGCGCGKSGYVPRKPCSELPVPLERP